MRWSQEDYLLAADGLEPSVQRGYSPQAKPMGVGGREQGQGATGRLVRRWTVCQAAGWLTTALQVDFAVPEAASLGWWLFCFLVWRGLPSAAERTSDCTRVNRLVGSLEALSISLVRASRSPNSEALQPSGCFSWLVLLGARWRFPFPGPFAGQARTGSLPTPFPLSKLPF